MDILFVLLFCAVIFGICYLVDKGFSKLFRNQQERHSGQAVRLNKKYGSIGLIVAILGLAVLFNARGYVLMYIAGPILILVGTGLVIYYMTYGIYYDKETFLVTNFGKKSMQYRYADIVSQQLFLSFGSVVIELYMRNGKAVQVQTGMKGAYGFMDYAFEAWCRQNGRTKEDCADFYDPDNSCWFPKTEEV